MEVLPLLKNEGAIIALTTTPVIIDLSAHFGGYVRLSSLSADDAAYVCALPTEDGSGVRITETSAEGAAHTAVGVPNVAEPVALGPSGAHRIPSKTHRFLWARTVTGTATLFVKPAGRPGEWGN